MPSFRATTRIARPPDQVFAYVADLTRHGEWSADELTVSGGPAAVGGEYTSTAKAKGREFSANIAISELDPPRRFAFVVHDDTGEYRHAFTFTPDADGTRVEREVSTGELTLGQRVLYYVALIPVRKPAAKQALAALKERMERA